MDIETLHVEFAKLHTECNGVLETLSKEGKDFTAEQKEQQDKRFARMDAIKVQIDQANKLAQFAQLKEKQQENIERAITGGGGAAAGDDKGSKARQEFERQQGNRGNIDIKKGVNAFMRDGAIPDEMKFTLISTSGSSIMLPKEVLAPYLVRRNINAFRRALQLTGYTPLETTTSDTFTLPVWDDTGNIGDAISESSTSNTTADSTLTGSVTLAATLYESKCKWFSNTLLNANGFDILSYVAPVLMKMLDKAQESAYTTTALSAFTTNYTVTATQVGVKYTDLIAWEHTLATAYRSDAVFVLSDSLYKALRGLVDDQHRPIIDLDPAGAIFDNAGKPMNAFIEKIHGYPIIVSDYMTALTNGSAAGGTEKTGLFVSGDAIKLRDVIPQRLTRYVNIPTQPDQTGYNLFANGDCQFVNAGGALFVY